MLYVLDQFSQHTHRARVRISGPCGSESVRTNFERLIMEKDFAAKTRGGDVPTA